MQIAQRTFLVTGGSSGLGAACVQQLLARGANVVIADLAPPDAAIAGSESRVRFLKTDVTSEDQVQTAIQEAQSTFGPLRGVVTCAGILHAERVVGRNGPASLEAFQRVVHVNLIGTFNVARLAATAMSSSEPDAGDERGVLVLVASVAAFDGQIGQAAYSAAKGGVVSLALPLARELGRFGIRVVAMAPGVFETPMMQAAPDKVRESLVEQTPFPARLGRPEEFAQSVLHVLENQMYNGCVVRLDGAMRMGAR